MFRIVSRRKVMKLICWYLTPAYAVWGRYFFHRRVSFCSQGKGASRMHPPDAPPGCTFLDAPHPGCTPPWMHPLSVDAPPISGCNKPPPPQTSGCTTPQVDAPALQWMHLHEDRRRADGRYASYWNAYLYDCMTCFPVCQESLQTRCIVCY